MLKVQVDGRSGFCGGVIRAIGTAEKYLGAGGSRLWSLGAIVHNDEELARLASLGLQAAASMDDVPAGEPVLIRAHGVPPEIYEAAAGHEVIDCTCPVVLRLQKDIREAYARVKALPIPGQLLIFGKVGHPEVLGLVGQVGGDAVVVEDEKALADALERGDVNVNADIELFSQTTKSPDGYRDLQAFLSSRMLGHLTVHDTICSQVATRHKHLAEFARTHDALVFVSGRTSSNGKVLFDLCRSVNPRTYHVNSVGELRQEWFQDGDFVGVCGATSTPKWLLDRIAAAVEIMTPAISGRP